MNKKGFTLVELLAVIALLGVIATIAVASVNGITDSINKNMLEKKLLMIEEAAVLMGEDNKNNIVYSGYNYDGNPCQIYYVYDLVPDYLDKDNDNDCLNLGSSEGCVVNPINKDDYLDNKEIIVYFKNKRIYAKVNMDNDLTCSN